MGWAVRQLSLWLGRHCSCWSHGHPFPLGAVALLGALLVFSLCCQSAEIDLTEFPDTWWSLPMLDGCFYLRSEDAIVLWWDGNTPSLEGSWEFKPPNKYKVLDVTVRVEPLGDCWVLDAMGLASDIACPCDGP